MELINIITTYISMMNHVTLLYLGGIIGLIVGIIFEKNMVILKQYDPAYSCDVYRKLGCIHADGVDCTVSTCMYLKEYKRNKFLSENEKSEG